MTVKKFLTPFAASGDLTPIPDTVQVDGSVSYPEGWGFNYSRDPATDPLAMNVERGITNQVLHDVTGAIGQLQQHGFPDYITSAENGGTAYAYDASAVVRYNGLNYISLVSANTALPTDATKWGVFSGDLSASATGIADAITATFAPALTALTNRQRVYVRAAAANATTTPTFSPNGLTAKTIVKNAGAALAANDIAGAGHWLALTYDSTLDKWVLGNPAISAGTFGALAAMGIGQGLEDDGSSNLRVKLDGATLSRSASGLKVTNLLTANTTLNVGAGQTYATVTAALAYLSSYRLLPGVTVTISVVGSVTEPASVIVTHPDAANIIITGAAAVTTTATAISAQSGTQGAYSVTLVVGSSAGMAVGDYVLVTASAGGTYPGVNDGCHIITAIPDGTHITITNKAQTVAWQGAGLTGANIACLHSIVTFGAFHGFQAGQGSMVNLQSLVLVGNGTGTTNYGVYGPSTGIAPGNVALTRVGIVNFGKALFIAGGTVTSLGDLCLSACGAGIWLSSAATEMVANVGYTISNGMTVAAEGCGVHVETGAFFTYAGGYLRCCANWGYGIRSQGGFVFGGQPGCRLEWNNYAGVNCFGSYGHVSVRYAVIQKSAAGDGMGNLYAGYEGQIDAYCATIGANPSAYQVYCGPHGRVDVFGVNWGGNSGAIYASYNSWILINSSTNTAGLTYSPALNTLGNNNAYIAN